MNSVQLPENPRILIPRLSHIGDCILTLPVANAIRDRFPKAWIAWAIESPGDRLIRECPAVDQVFTIPKGWLKKPRMALSLRKLFRLAKFDVVIDPQSLTKSSALGWLSGARVRIGLNKPIGRELAPWLNNVNLTSQKKHVVDRSLDLLQPLGIDSPIARFNLQIPDSAIKAADTIRNKMTNGQPYAVFNPGAGWKSRQWDNDRFGKVAEHLSKQYRVIPLVTWFGDEEEEMADSIVKSSEGHAIKAPATGLWDLAGLIQKSQFLIGCDTGPTHLAAAIEVPCITLFGTTEPEVSGPYELDQDNKIHIRIQKYYQAGSSRERRKAENAAMMEISADQVCSSVDQMMKNNAFGAVA